MVVSLRYSVALCWSSWLAFRDCVSERRTYKRKGRGSVLIVTRNLMSCDLHDPAYLLYLWFDFREEVDELDIG